MIIPFLAAIGAGLWSLGGASVRNFENLAANDIRSKLTGGNANVSVKAKLNGVIGGAFGDLREVKIVARDFETVGLPLFCEPTRSKKGLIRSLHLVLDNFSLAGLRVAHLEAKIPDCRFDYALAISKRQIRLSQSGVGVGTVRLKERDLEAFILRKFKEIKRVTVQLRPDRAIVEGYGEFLIVQTNFRVEARLVSPNGTTLELSDANILFDGVPAEPQARRVLLETLNPVVDLNKDLALHGAIAIESITIGEGVLTARGKTRIPRTPP